MVDDHLTVVRADSGGPERVGTGDLVLPVGMKLNDVKGLSTLPCRARRGDDRCHADIHHARARRQAAAQFCA